MVVRVYKTRYLLEHLYMEHTVVRVYKTDIFMTRSHVEHIGSACLQDRAYFLERSHITHNCFG